MERINEILKKIRFGVDYYPEHWPQNRWDTDAKLMQELGIQVVRMGEFAWQKIEPEENKYDFDWLDDAIHVLGNYGIYTMLGTPTAAPPAWIIEQSPDILPMDSQGRIKSFGGRHHDCQSNKTYREHIKRLVTSMAEHYKDNPYVIGWQIDNELGNSHEELCMCDSCRFAFEQWLEKKYGTIEELNAAWGTVFWSQTYDDFKQIPTPRQTPTVHNPSLLLNWKRFCSDLVVDFQKMQIEIIKRIAPHQKVTHNLMGFYDKTNYYELSKDLDFAANDQYPTGYYFEKPQGPAEVAACMDFIRSVKRKNFWMMELEAGATGGSIIGVNPKPGQNRLWTSQCVAHGADVIVYFRWRTCLFGSEQFWHGILPHQGIPQRRYYEIQESIRQLSPVMDDVNGIVTKGKVAILFSYDQDWAIKLQPQHPDITYSGEILKYHKCFFDRNIPVDFISPEWDFKEYAVLVAPLLYLMNPVLEKKLQEYVAQGGCLVLSMRTGVMNMENVCMSELPLPGNIGQIAGIIVEEYDSLLGGRTVSVRYGEKTGIAKTWCDIIKPIEAETLVTYDSDYYKGLAAVTVNSYGQGKVYYVGTALDESCMDWLMEKIVCGMDCLKIDNPNIELTIRRGDKKDYLFVLNHSGEKQEITIPGAWESVTLILEPYDVHILSKEKR